MCSEVVAMMQEGTDESSVSEWEIREMMPWSYMQGQRDHWDLTALFKGSCQRSSGERLPLKLFRTLHSTAGSTPQGIIPQMEFASDLAALWQLLKRILPL